MNDNAALISSFYTAFQQRNFSGMNACYADDIIFNDPVFGVLEGNDVKAMWEMLCKNAKDLQLNFGNIQLLDEEYATCDWTANYTFSKTGRRVENKIKAHMRIQNGRITEHTDQFDLYRWSRMAMGLPGILLGWSTYMQQKIKSSAHESLAGFIQKKSA